MADFLPMMGVLPPGASIERPIPDRVPKTWTAAVQNRPGGRVRITNRTDSHVSLRNEDPERLGPYIVLFVSPTALDNLMAIQKLVGALRGPRR